MPHPRTAESFPKIKSMDKRLGYGFWDFISSRNLDPETAFAFAKIIWPDFIAIGDFILLSENFDEDNYNKLLVDVDKNLIEGTVNTIYLDTLFSPNNEPVDCWEWIGEILCESWKAKASICFPDREFFVQFAWYSEGADPGVSIIQSKWIK